MSMKKNNNNFIFLIGLILLGIIIDESYCEPKRKEEEKQKTKIKQKEEIEKWSKETVDYFKSFNCSELKDTVEEIKIDKFIVVESYTKHDCTMNLDDDLEFEKYKNFNNFYSRKIDSVNVIIWIVQKPGKEEGTYSNFTKAVRFESELNFINKSTRTIYKKISLDYLGDAPKEIRRKQGTAGGVEYFGTKPYENIYNTILNEL